ncbi:MAG: hypothetical protein ACNI25_06710 [Halarcobacter sp.]
MLNLIKVVVLGLVAFGLLVFFTAEKPKQIVANDNVVNLIKYEKLPDIYELVGIDKDVSKKKIFKRGVETLIVVGNHDSLSVVKDLPKLFKISQNYVMVANISSAPWFVKKMFIPSKLEELNKGTNIPMIYDDDAQMVNTLNLSDTTKTKFFAYLLTKEGMVSKIYEGSVKAGALDGSMTEEEKKKSLEPLVKLLK